MRTSCRHSNDSINMLAIAIVIAVVLVTVYTNGEIGGHGG